MSELQLINRDAVLKKCGFGKDSLYRLMKRGEFPLAVSTIRNCVGWYKHEVDEWILSRPRKHKVKELQPV